MTVHARIAAARTNLPRALHGGIFASVFNCLSICSLLRRRATAAFLLLLLDQFLTSFLGTRLQRLIEIILTLLGSFGVETLAVIHLLEAAQGHRKGNALVLL